MGDCKRKEEEIRLVLKALLLLKITTSFNSELDKLSFKFTKTTSLD